MFGVVLGTAHEPRVSYLEEAVPVSEDLLSSSGPASPNEVFRVAAPCASRACAHFQNGRCHLVEKVIQELPPVVDALPACVIREGCRWFRQEGGAACARCPMVVTDAPPLDKRMVRVTDLTW